MLATLGTGCVATVALLVFGIWSLILVFRLRGMLRTAAEDARAAWATTETGPAS